MTENDVNNNQLRLIQPPSKLILSQSQPQSILRKELRCFNRRHASPDCGTTANNFDISIPSPMANAETPRRGSFTPNSKAVKFREHIAKSRSSPRVSIDENDDFINNNGTCTTILHSKKYTSSTNLPSPKNRGDESNPSTNDENSFVADVTRAAEQDPSPRSACCWRRRTSLPLNNSASVIQSNRNAILQSNVSEARGLIMDLLATNSNSFTIAAVAKPSTRIIDEAEVDDSDRLSPQVLSCLRAVAQLLNAANSPAVTPSAYSAFASSFGTTPPFLIENPYNSGELLSASKPRVSNITFSTVTSATGLPTIAAEPSQPRSSSYWKPFQSQQQSPAAATPPQSQLAASHQHSNIRGGELCAGAVGKESATNLSVSAGAKTTTRSASAVERIGGLDEKSEDVEVKAGKTSEVNAAESCSFHLDTGASVSTPLNKSTAEEYCGPSSTTTVAETSLSTGHQHRVSNMAPFSGTAVAMAKRSGVCDHPKAVVNNRRSILIADADALLPTSTAEKKHKKKRVAEERTALYVSDEAAASTSSSSADGDDIDEADEFTVVRTADGSMFKRAELDADRSLQRIAEWGFPIFRFAERHRTSVLSRMTYSIFKQANLFRIFKLSPTKFFNFFHSLEIGYWDIPYHNRIHAADVLHGAFYLTCHSVRAFVGRPPQRAHSARRRRHRRRQTRINRHHRRFRHRSEAADYCSASSSDEEEERPEEADDRDELSDADGGLSDDDDDYHHHLHQRRNFSFLDTVALPLAQSMNTLELMALYTAAAMHDYDHPGRTNAFLVAAEDQKAILYNDRSVLENHHAAESWRLLCQPSNNFIESLDSAETKRFRYLVLEYILATDLKQHFDIITQFNEKAADIDLSSESDRVLVSQMLIKFADINSPAKPFPLHRQWTERICQEFYEQGDEEKRRHMQVSPYMDRDQPAVAKLQDSFIAHIVNPLAVALNEAGLLPVLPGLEESELIINLKHNHQKWLIEIEEECSVAITTTTTTASVSTTVETEKTTVTDETDVSDGQQQSSVLGEEGSTTFTDTVVIVGDGDAPTTNANSMANNSSGGVLRTVEKQLKSTAVVKPLSNNNSNSLAMNSTKQQPVTDSGASQLPTTNGGPKPVGNAAGLSK